MAKGKHPHRFHARDRVHMPEHDLHGHIVRHKGVAEDGDPLYLIRHADGGGIERESALELEPETGGA